MRRLVFSFWSLNWFENTEEKMERKEDMVILSKSRRSRTTQERLCDFSPIRERKFYYLFGERICASFCGAFWFFSPRKVPFWEQITERERSLAMKRIILLLIHKRRRRRRHESSFVFAVFEVGASC